MNTLCMTGNLGGDAKVNNVSGTAVANFSVAMKSGYGDKAQTVWLQASLWGKQAESKLVDYLVKGQAVALTGEFSMREHEGKQYPQLRVSTIDFIGGKAEGGARNASAPEPKKDLPNDTPPLDDDIPF